MYKIVVLAIMLSIVMGGKRGFAESLIPDTKGMEHTAELLTRWRDVRQLVLDGAIQQSRSREAAMVLAWGLIFEYLSESDETELLELLREHVGSPEDISRRLGKALEEFDAPNDSFAGKRGRFFSAYVSTLDQSGQIYNLYVPESYNPEMQYALHVYPKDLDYKGLKEVKDPLPYIIASCQGRGIEGLGELDALETIRDVSTHYNIDPDRIYLRGGSIGGGSVWRMAARYPDIFAAALVDCGWTWTSRLHLENVSNIPMWIYHDATDVWVPVDESRTAVKLLSGMASPIIYSETSGRGHEARMEDLALKSEEWLRDQRRNCYPAEVTYITSTPLRGHAYWLDILEFTDPNALATVKARVTPGRDQSQLFLHMRNIDVLAVDLPGELYPSDKPLIVAASGAPLRVPPPLPQRIYVHREEGITENLTCSISSDDPRPSMPYRPYAASGLNSLYVSGEPLMIVRGTGGDNRGLVDSIGRFCELLSKGNIGWWAFPMHPCVTGKIPIKADTEISIEDERRCNLILVGPADVNCVLARIAPNLPAVERDGFLHVGEEKYDLAGASYGLFHYNPEAPERYVMVMSSPEIEFYKSINNGIADLMNDERPLGLVAKRLNPPRTIRRIMWNKDWSVPDSANETETLPALFTENNDTVRDIYHQAMRAATGADFAAYYKGESDYYPLWESAARWHDLAAGIGQAGTFFVGWASGADLQKLTFAKVELFPPVDKTEVLPQIDYRLVMDPRMACGFVRIVGHPMRDAVAVRADLFDAIRRVATHPQLGANSDTGQTKE
ncbi:hypothetical protein ACFL6S_02845 [Candidatus Poribacteria bacterium]